jgi:hypothetical protein
VAKPVYRGISGPSIQAMNTVWTVTKPTGVVSGDLMLATFSYEGPASSFTAGTIPSGWALATTPVDIGWPHAAVIYYKIAGGSEPSDYTWTLSTAETGVKRIVAYSSVNPTTPIHAGAALVAPSDATPPYQYQSDEITTSVPDCLLFAHFAMVTGTPMTWTAGSMTERGDLLAGAEVTSDAAYDQGPVPAGTYSRTGAATANGAAQGAEVTLLAIAPFPSPPEAPASTVAPVVTGNPTASFTLSCSEGTWTGDPTPVLTYQWQRDAVNIGGATASSYLLTALDVGAMVRCRVTGTNATAAVVAASNALGPVEAAPAAPDTFLMTDSGLVASAGRLMTAGGLLPPP